MRIAEPRIAQPSVPIKYGGVADERLDPLRSLDAVLSTRTLCTIPDVDTALVQLQGSYEA